LVLCRSGILDRCAALLADRVAPEIDRLAARGGAAVALATALALRTDTDLLLGDTDPDGRPAFSGDPFPGARVALIEDVVLTGSHTLASAKALRDDGQQVLTVIGLLDRERGGRPRLEDADLTCTFLFSEAELLA
jgi:orotate phosphoribosyltransferase